MSAGNHPLYYPILLFASFILFIYMPFRDLKFGFHKEPQLSFVTRNGTQFVLYGEAFYVNGWNSYWLMAQSMDEFSRHRVREMLQTGAKMGLSVCRTWAFNDGDYNALQISPGHFNEQVFKVI